MTQLGQTIMMQCHQRDLDFKIGIGWTYRVRPDSFNIEQVRAAIEQRENVTVVLNVEDHNLPEGERVTIIGPDGTAFPKVALAVKSAQVYDAEGEAHDVRDWLQSNHHVGTENSLTAMAMAHRAGQSREPVSVHGKSLRSVEKQPSNADDQHHLIDDLAMAKETFIGATPPAVRKTIEGAIKVARGYILDRAASYRIGQLCVTAAKLIADSQEFARIPYPVVWAELDQVALLEGMQSRGGTTLTIDDLGADERLGFLYTGHGVYSAVKAKDKHGGYHSSWTPFAFRMGRPTTHAQLARWEKFVGTGADVYDRFLWGNVYDDLDRSRRKALRLYTGLDITLPDDIVKPNDPAPLRGILNGGGAGDWKVALAVLLCLIRPGVAEKVELRKPMRKLTARGSRKLVGLTTVTINISARATKSRIKRGTDEARRGITRWHEVRGHYMHNRVAKEADCIHDWTEVEPDRWTCEHCGGKRAWREYPNGRGSIEAGVVAKHYKVTSKRG